jgi:hypothetical protein
MNDISIVFLRLGGILVMISSMFEQKVVVLEETMNAKF